MDLFKNFDNMHDIKVVTLVVVRVLKYASAEEKDEFGMSAYCMNHNTVVTILYYSVIIDVVCHGMKLLVAPYNILVFLPMRLYIPGQNTPPTQMPL